MNKGYYKSPVGILEIGEENNTIFYIKFIREYNVNKGDKSYYLDKCIAQFEEYFSGKRRRFDLKLAPKGTDFQKQVWKEVSRIPYGKTKSYLKVSELLGDRGLVRAVGGANNKNPIPIIIPCHRVIGSDGALIGYAGGLERKEWLLYHELEHDTADLQLKLF